jgi:hypothetical protein
LLQAVGEEEELGAGTWRVHSATSVAMDFAISLAFRISEMIPA